MNSLKTITTPGMSKRIIKLFYFYFLDFRSEICRSINDMNLCGVNDTSGLGGSLLGSAVREIPLPSFIYKV